MRVLPLLAIAFIAGKVAAIQPDQRRIEFDDGNAVVLDASTDLRRDQIPIALQQLQPGEWIRVGLDDMREPVTADLTPALPPR